VSARPKLLDEPAPDEAPVEGRRSEPKKERPGRLRRRDALVAYAMISPAACFFVVFILAPTIGALVLSFYRFDLLTPPEPAGLDNYRILFTDQVTVTVLVNTFVFTFWAVLLHVVPGLALAIAVNRPIGSKLKYFLRTSYFFPLLVSWSAVALIWRYTLDPNFGIFHYYAQQFSSTMPNFLTSPTWAMPALIFIDLWKTIGFTFIILLAGLQTVPRRLYEAALIDGAGAFRRFWNVTLPMMSPTLLFVLVITFIGAFQLFEPMFIITEGGPGNATRTIVMHIYETGFRRFQMGYASTLAIVVLAVVMVVTLLQLWASRYWVHHD
jgi:ABC-type sugar transport system permease subunit